MTIKLKLVMALALVLGLFATTSGVTFLTTPSGVIVQIAWVPLYMPPIPIEATALASGILAPALRSLS